MKYNNLKTDCRFFRGDIPCKPHKLHGVHCTDERGNACQHYDQVDKRILIIKLGAIGDVIRTTPLLHKLREVEPRAEIWWLTLTPDILPQTIDTILPFTPQSLATLGATSFDIVYNLDKDREACALCTSLKAAVKKGYTLQGENVSRLMLRQNTSILPVCSTTLAKPTQKATSGKYSKFVDLRLTGRNILCRRPNRTAGNCPARELSA